MRRYISEFIGTFTLIFCGTGAMVVNDIDGALTHPGVACVWGLVVMAMIYTFGDNSGAHFNPAVTVAFACAKKFDWKEVPKYVIAQFLGGLLASSLLWVIFPTNEFYGATIPTIEPWRAFIMELLLTYFLMLTIINVATGSKEVGIIAGIAIGGVVLLEAMFAGPVTKASMNPVRSITPAIISGHYEHLWLYLIAPFIGAILAIISWNTLKNGKEKTL